MISRWVCWREGGLKIFFWGFELFGISFKWIIGNTFLIPYLYIFPRLVYAGNHTNLDIWIFYTEFAIGANKTASPTKPEYYTPRLPFPKIVVYNSFLIFPYRQIWKRLDSKDWKAQTKTEKSLERSWKNFIGWNFPSLGKSPFAGKIMEKICPTDFPKWKNVGRFIWRNKFKNFSNFVRNFSNRF